MADDVGLEARKEARTARGIKGTRVAMGQQLEDERAGREGRALGAAPRTGAPPPRPTADAARLGPEHDRCPC